MNLTSRASQALRVWFVYPALALLVLILAACAGRQGVTYTRLSDGGIGPVIPNVALSFIKEDGSSVRTISSDTSGRYSVSLDPGRYYVLASHVDFEDYNSAPGFAVVSGNTRGTANFFLREPQITSVLIVRHGEKLDPNSNAQTEPLSAAGQVRAGHLRDTLLRAGITAVYSTDFTRTRDTVAPLAATFRLPTQLYADPAALAAAVLAQHRGDVVLVAAHSNSVSTVANAFGASVPTQDIDDYDNLYITSVAGTTTSVVNLQYGADSMPDITKNDRRVMTLLLVGAGAQANAPEPAELQHTARKAGVQAIYTSTVNNALVAPLANALGLTPTTFNAGDMPTFANLLLSSHAQQTVVVAATPDELRALIRELRAEPFPVIYATDTDHLVMVSRFPAGAVRVVQLRF